MPQAGGSVDGHGQHGRHATRARPANSVGVERADRVGVARSGHLWVLVLARLAAPKPTTPSLYERARVVARTHTRTTHSTSAPPPTPSRAIRSELRLGQWNVVGVVGGGVYVACVCVCVCPHTIRVISQKNKIGRGFDS